MFDLMAVETFHTEERGLFLSKGRIGGSHVRQDISRCNKNGEDLGELTVQAEAKDLLHTREHAKRLTEANTADLRYALDFISPSKQVRSRCYCDHCQCFPFSDCTWFLCVGVRKGFKNKGSNWFCGRCVHMYNWREGQSSIVIETCMVRSQMTWTCTQPASRHRRIK